jgi:hypothetical protein
MRLPTWPIAFLAAAAAHAEAQNAHALCQARADAALTALGEARYEAATTGFDAALSARYSAAKLGQDYAALSSKYGPLLGRGRPHTGDMAGHPVVMTPLIYERGTATVEVQCDGDGTVSDLRLLATQAMTPR